MYVKPNDHDTIYLLCLQVSHVHPCLFIGWSPIHNSPMLIFTFLLVRLMSCLPFSSMPLYWSVLVQKSPIFNPCLLIGLALVHKFPIFILAFLLVRLLSTNLPFLSLPSYWSGSCPQVSHFHPCLLIGWALVHNSLIFILASYWSGSIHSMFILIFQTFNRGAPSKNPCLDNNILYIYIPCPHMNTSHCICPEINPSHNSE